ncbi:MAG: peptide deformylase [Proteobacteria bacterium]|jgi:peptide deformylase|nr:peptide deformylase [Pseudomonadota bacterium]
MALLDILVYPDPRLRDIAQKVDAVTAIEQELVSSMAETMYAAPGIGLAAIQVGVDKRIIVIDISEYRDDLLVLINPEITEQDGVQVSEEGCLSVPDIYAEVARAEKITVRHLDQSGEPAVLSAGGLLAVCIQHEIDHLDGKVFVDYLSRMKQSRIRKKLLKAGQQKSAA